ncbi:MAG: cohesin domain-containing protein [Candidatus Pacebacteria bacterium]|jgi:hypothetical protein|nr:cohesin domain-containing protein [Candidatus Paceibacterota bacterium]
MRNNLIISILVGISLVFAAAPVLAANFAIEPINGKIEVGQAISLSLNIKNADREINAVSGVVSYPKDLLEAVNVSKAGSILNFWIKEPAISSEKGQISFEGAVVSGGFRGTSGKIATLQFIARKTGTAALYVLKPRILANDGSGTDIAVSSSETKVVVQAALPPTVNPSATQKITSVGSPTHPDASLWYSDRNPSFAWQTQTGIIAVRTSIDNDPLGAPSADSEELPAGRKFKNLENGIWYFHIQFKNDQGWSKVYGARINIDATAPDDFTVKSVDGSPTGNPKPTITFGTGDLPSGVDRYLVEIDGKLINDTDEGSMTLPLLSVGRHRIKITAYDKAGNTKAAESDIEILPVIKPLIVDYPRELLPGYAVFLKGIFLPDSRVKIYIESLESGIKIEELKTDTAGKWMYFGRPLEAGLYSIWTRGFNALGGSEISDKVYIKISSDHIITIGGLSIGNGMALGICFSVILALLLLLFAVLLRMDRIKAHANACETNFPSLVKNQNTIRGFRGFHRKIHLKIKE